jgi:hypothetical protein
MKSQFRSFVAVLTASVLVLSSFTTAPAGSPAAAVVSPEAKSDVQVKFLGANGDFLYFEVNLQQALSSRSNFRIRNEQGNELYAETIFEKTATRKLKIAKDEAEKLEFLYNTGKGEVKKTLQIKIRVQEAIEVKEIARG